ncbi:ATP-binding protein [Streptomyces sp. NPDC052301]|uniref:ATP-binding protein n=1 Tax=Streptomyces sp. NPDC052301 TaxID=3365687 RepID=UPI0037D4149D
MLPWGPPVTGKTHLAAGLGNRARQTGHRVAFATAVQRVARLAEARVRRRPWPWWFLARCRRPPTSAPGWPEVPARPTPAPGSGGRERDQRLRAW